MDYTQALKNYETARSDHRQAKQDLRAAEEAYHQAREKYPEAYEELTEVMASHEVGDASQADVEKAKQAHTDTKAAIEQAKIKVDVLQKLVPKRREQESKALKDLAGPAKKHYQGKAIPIMERMLTAISELEECNEASLELRKEMSANRLNTSILPLPMRSIQIDTGYVRPETIKSFKQKLEQLKSQAS